MKLPNAGAAVVDRLKITGYLLNPLNAQNQGKARQFGQFGFLASDWQALATALAEHPVINDVSETERSPYGIKYVVECHLTTPDGRNPCLRSVWMVDNGQSTPRLVTAY